MRSRFILAGLAGLVSFSPSPSPAHAATDVDARPVPVAVTSITATSTYTDAHDAYAPWHIINPVVPAGPKARQGYNFAWCEGKPDEGVGEGITIAFARPTAIAHVKVAAGVWKNDHLFTSNNHISQLVITTDDNRKLTVAVPDARGKYAEVDLGGAAVNTLTVSIGAVTKAQMNDSCLSEIQLWTDDAPLAPIVGVPAAALAALPDALADVSHALDKHDDDALAPLVDFPFNYKATDWYYENGDEKAAAQRFASAKKLADSAVRGRPAPDLEDPMVLGDGPGAVVLPFGSRDLQPKWRFVWRDNAWHLRAIDY